MPQKKWARVRRAGAHGLRRGAWYPVVNDQKTTIAFLDVNKRNVAVDRSLLEFSEVQPYLWSIVAREPDDPSVARASQAHLEPTYGVCPNCRTRANVAYGADTSPCPQCGNDYGVDWAHPC